MDLFGCIVALFREGFFTVLCLANFFFATSTEPAIPRVLGGVSKDIAFVLPQFPARVECGRGVFHRCRVPAARALLDFLLSIYGLFKRCEILALRVPAQKRVSTHQIEKTCQPSPSRLRSRLCTITAYGVQCNAIHLSLNIPIYTPRPPRLLSL